jgi:putative ABC transport system ATP-binding protein
MPTELAIELRDVTKAYSRPDGTPFVALSDISFEVQAGEMVAVVGRSGSGKSTLLNLLAGLDQPSSGTIRSAGTELRGLSERALSEWRGRNVGVVFQFFQLLPTLTVLENVVLAMELVGRIPPRERETRARDLLGRVGISDQADKLPATLSGGQQQRAAIARALANDPALLVADEPTGNLDSKTSEEIVGLFESLAAQGKTLVIVTHEEALARRAGRVLRLADGKLVQHTVAGGDA